MLLGDGFTALAEGMLEPHADEVGADPCPCLPLLAVLAEWTAVQQTLLLRFGWGGAFADELLESVLDDRVLEPGHPAAVALWGGAVRRPDPDRLVTAGALVLRAAGHLPEADRGPLLAMAAWLRWALGGGTAADSLMSAALDVSPRERLALALRSLIDAGVLPEWVFSADPLADPLRALA